MASKRNYLTQEELAQFADITITDPAEADDQITMAEEMIDAWVGGQCKSVTQVLQGRCAAGGANTFTLEASRHQNTMQQDYLTWCFVEIIGGTGVGKTRRRITGQTYAGVCTVDSAWDTAPDSTSIYRIWQEAKFPRKQDVYFDGISTPQRYYKTVPEKVRRAVAAQVEYIIQMGVEFFASDQSNYDMEKIGDYMYKNGANSPSGAAALIAPKAKLLLRGITNRKGVIIVE